MNRWMVWIGVVLCAGAGVAQEWVDITPGADLAGWTVLSGEWTVEDGEVVGRLHKTPEQKDQQVNIWLIYEKEFADLEIEAEFITPVPANGGIQVRSHWLPLLPLPEDTDIDEAPKDCYGYQAGIETRRRLGTGRIIEENGRGMLAEPAMDAAKTLKQRDWNKMRVVARGPVIEIYLQDVLACRIEDEAYIKGYLMLQVRADEMADEVTEIRYRNLRVKDYGRDGAWRSLFDGKSLDGWKEWGDEKWLIEDGAIIGSSGPKESEGYLGTIETWKDFRVRGSFKMMGDGNFGLFYHSSITLKDDGYPVIAGLQGEVEPRYPSMTGWVYESYQRGWLVKPDLNTAGALALRRNAWNEIEIRSLKDAGSGAQHITTWVNGVRTLDHVDTDPRLNEGFFALQLHTGGVDGIAWKDLFVAE